MLLLSLVLAAERISASSPHLVAPPRVWRPGIESRVLAVGGPVPVDSRRAYSGGDCENDARTLYETPPSPQA
jgi:hypothetical protein